MNPIYKFLTLMLLLLTPSCAKSYQTYPPLPRTKQLIPPRIVAEAELPRPPMMIKSEPPQPQSQPQSQSQPKPPFKPKPPVANKNIVIVIDAGHGGDDYGTYSLTKPRIHEKNLTLTTSHFLKTFLNQLGYQTIMTREKDTFIALDQRAIFANNQKPNLFVSVHYNSAPSREAEGVEVYYYNSQEDKPRARSSKRLAEVVLKNIISNTKANSRGTKHGNFAVIRETKMPAILVEGGFLSNDSEMSRIKDPVYMKQIAWGIANGIDQYFKARVASSQ